MYSYLPSLWQNIYMYIDTKLRHFIWAGVEVGVRDNRFMVHGSWYIRERGVRSAMFSCPRAGGL